SGGGPAGAARASLQGQGNGSLAPGTAAAGGIRVEKPDCLIPLHRLRATRGTSPRSRHPPGDATRPAERRTPGAVCGRDGVGVGRGGGVEEEAVGRGGRRGDRLAGFEERGIQRRVAWGDSFAEALLLVLLVFALVPLPVGQFCLEARAEALHLFAGQRLLD